MSDLQQGVIDVGNYLNEFWGARAVVNLKSISDGWGDGNRPRDEEEVLALVGDGLVLVLHDVVIY